MSNLQRNIYHIIKYKAVYLVNLTHMDLILVDYCPFKPYRYLFHLVNISSYMILHMHRSYKLIKFECYYLFII